MGPVEILADSDPAIHWFESVLTVAFNTPSHVSKSQPSGHCWLGTGEHGLEPSSKLGCVTTFTLLFVACATCTRGALMLDRERMARIRIVLLKRLERGDVLALPNPCN
jgi:hypothetical protein